MGSPDSNMLAEAVLRLLDCHIMSKMKDHPTRYLWYVDGIIFVWWSGGTEELNSSCGELNNIHPNIRFTIELESSDVLPYLDVLLRKQIWWTAGMCLYRKPINVPNIIPITSSVPFPYKESTLHYYIWWAYRVSTDESNLQHIPPNYTKFARLHSQQSAGYPRSFVDAVHKK